MNIISQIHMDIDILASWARTYGRFAIIAVATGDAEGARHNAKQASYFAHRQQTAREALTALQRQEVA